MIDSDEEDEQNTIEVHLPQITIFKTSSEYITFPQESIGEEEQNLA